MVESYSNQNGLKCKVFRDTELIDQNLNLIYSVGKGSYNKPGLVIVEY